MSIDLIKKCKDRTTVGGLHIISAFTKNGDFYRKNMKTDNFYLNESELKEIYSDWEVL